MNERNLRDEDFTEDHDVDAGQATTEYALVLLGAALIALLLVGWATAGGGAGKIGSLLDHVFDAISKKF
jgi:Flp pilus assembly pilin Flp